MGNRKSLKSWALTGCAAFIMAQGVAYAAEPSKDINTDARVAFNIASQNLGAALNEFGLQSGLEISFVEADIKGRTVQGLAGAYDPVTALERLLENTGIAYRVNELGTILVGAATRQAGYRAISLTSDAEYQARLGGYAEDEDKDKIEEIELEEIVVTGSHIRGVGPVGSQVFTYDRGDIDIQGYSTLPQFIQSLPQNIGAGISESTSGLSFASNANDNTNSGTGINLRGLGNVATLTLLNGRRVAPAGSDGNFVDISMIPLSAIERVEVLTDGASAIYGSDAIGGVVNFKMRKDYDGAETRLRHGFATQGGLEEDLVGQTFGKTWDQGHGLISYEYYHRDPLEAKDREFSKNAPDLYQLLPEQERHSLFLSGAHNFTEAFEVFATAYYNNRASSRRNIFFPDEPVEQVEGDTDQFGASLGAELDLNKDWRAEVSGSWSRTENAGRTIVSLEEVRTGAGRMTGNLSFDAQVDGSLFHMAGGDVKLAVGGHFRHDKFGDLDLPSDNPVDDVSRDVYAIFGELYVPLVGEDNRMPGVEKLEISISGRYEDYSDFGSSTDPKFGVLWSPVEGLNLRGSYGTSFRAPLFPELDGSGSSALLVCSIPNTMSPSGTSCLLALLALGNPDLQPETATTWSAGFDLQPAAVPGLNISATYFDIEYKDRIGRITFNFFTDLNDPRFAAVVDFNSPDAELLALIQTFDFQQNFTSFPGFGPPADFADADVIVDGRLQNLARTEIRGLDFNVSYSLDTPNFGNWNFFVNGTYILNFLEQISDSNPAFDEVGSRDRPVEWRGNGGVTWNYEGFTANLTVNYVDSYLNTLADPDAPVDSWTTVNLTLSYNTTDRFGGWLDNTTFALSAVNLFDQDPPFVEPDPIFDFTNIFYDPAAASPTGRVLSFQITKKW